MKFLKLGHDLNLHAPDQHGHSFNVKRYYELEYGYESSSFNIFQYFNISLLEYFFDNFEFVYHSCISLNVKAFGDKLFKSNFLTFLNVKKRPNFYFRHDHFIMVLSVIDNDNHDQDDCVNLEECLNDNYTQEMVDEGEDESASNFKNIYKNINKNNSKIHVSIHYPSNKIFDSWEKQFSFLEKYVLEDTKKNQVCVLMKNQYGEYDFEPLNIRVPKINLELNYGQSFQNVYEKIVNKLSNNNKGLYMFHGPPGTGKSSFIKYLTSVIDKEFIFIPATFLEKFISDPDLFSILIRRKKCILILEDAEKILISRDDQENQFISTLLNISDGILSDILEASIILTFNCEHTKIDKALRRKGRTMIDYKFDKLKVEESKKMAKYLNLSDELLNSINEPMTLSEIYNMSDDNKFYSEDENKNKVIGFGAK